MQKLRTLAETIMTGISRVMVGKEKESRLLLAGLLAGGHVLLEDMPGTGKTVLARTLARLIDCPFARVQCTPDLLPSDVTGTSIYDMKHGDFVFHPGPVFTSVLLADELNRATPRTQAALLECMEEHQVTSDGTTRRLPSPFFVIATQNPIELQGTFSLPEAQMDRFMLRLSLGYPTTAESIQLLSRFEKSSPLDELSPVANADELIAAQQEVSAVSVSEAVRGYIVALAEHTRQDEALRLGVSTRGMLALLRCAQAYALMSGRDYVTPDDVKALAPAVWAHRLVIRNAYGQTDRQQEAVARALNAVPVPTESI